MLEEAISIRKELNDLLNKACMRLRKWRSNSEDRLSTVPEDMRETENIQIISPPDQCHMALGIHWHTIQDTLHVATPVEDKPTKRKVASDVAGTLTSPAAVIHLKILLQ